MPVLGIDLGGTKLALAVFMETGELVSRKVIALEGRKGTEAGKLITGQIIEFLEDADYGIQSIGISVPGIAYLNTGRVWAPNIPGWDDYPLHEEVKQVSGNIPVNIDSDRACYILGEQWQGNAQNCRDAIYLAVGTGIGAGILVNGTVLRGANDIAGAVGWMALCKPYQTKYIPCGCFEHYASGNGIAKLARENIAADKAYNGILKGMKASNITASDVFDAYEKKDPIAAQVITGAVKFWGMAAANLVSIFNPEKIIFGGGVFGPAVKLLPEIKEEAAKWAQPVSITQVKIESSALNSDAGVYGAGFLAIQALKNPINT